MPKVIYVILYTYEGWDGVIDQLMTDEEGNYVGYLTREEAEKHLPKSDSRNTWEIQKVIIS